MKNETNVAEWTDSADLRRFELKDIEKYIQGLKEYLNNEDEMRMHSIDEMKIIAEEIEVWDEFMGFIKRFKINIEDNK